jgi:16S rRNA (guanine527-N7)-methyltransferase
MSDRAALRQRLVAGLAELALEPPPGAIDCLLGYVDLLVQWNRAYNLTAVREPGDMLSRHLLDSLSITPWVRGSSLADLGSGAGLPGIPLAIFAPRRRILLVDSNGKKARFLREAVRQLGLANVEVAESRVEDVRGTFDCVTARAFTSLADMLDRGAHLLAADGRWLALKGRFPHDELADVPAAFVVESVDAIAVPGLDAERHVVVIGHADNLAIRESIAP